MSQTGTVKFFKQSKGFGFINPDEGEGDIFFHKTSLIDAEANPWSDDKVSYEVEDTDRGLSAVRVTITEKGSGSSMEGDSNSKYRASDVIPALCEKIRFLEGKSLSDQEIIDELMGA
jgi:cold shock protein